MKKLLGLLAVAPMAITACSGGSAEPGLYGVNVGSSTSMMDQIVSEDIDFAGTWGDARRFNGTGDNSSIVAIGVEENRIANDGIQAAESMSSHDMFWAQELFTAVVNSTDEDLQVEIGTDDDGKPEDEHVLELYGHEAYTRPTVSNNSLTYLKSGVPTDKAMVKNIPADGAADGALFNAAGEVIGNLDIMFIPSTDPTHAQTASTALETWLNAKHTNGGTVTISVAADYDAAATQLASETIDLAFLPVNTWAEGAPDSNFILQAGRSAQVATLDINDQGVAYQPTSITNQKLVTNVMNRFSQLYVADVTTAAIDANEALSDSDEDKDAYITAFKASMDNKADEFYGWANAVNAYATALATDAPELIAGSYESYIWAKRGSDIETLVTSNYQTADYKNDWTIDVSDMALNYGFTSTTSSSTFLFPELWLKNHLGATLELN